MPAVILLTGQYMVVNPQGTEGYCSCLVQNFFSLELLSMLFIC